MDAAHTLIVLYTNLKVSFFLFRFLFECYVRRACSEGIIPNSVDISASCEKGLSLRYVDAIGIEVSSDGEELS